MKEVVTHLKKVKVKKMIKDLFTEQGYDFKNPTKQGLKKVVSALAKRALAFGDPKMIKNQKKQMLSLVKKIK